MENLIVKAVKEKWVFPTNQGNVGVETLYHANDNILEQVYANLQKVPQGLFSQKKDERLELVQLIAIDRQEEKENKKKVKAKESLREQIEEIKSQQRLQKLAELPEEELEKELEKLK